LEFRYCAFRLQVVVINRNHRDCDCHESFYSAFMRSAVFSACRSHALVPPTPSKM
jgi:hypothetical protein